jgi:hypothetical protein
MPFAFGTQRPQVVQQIITFPLTVPGAGAAVSIGAAQNLDKSRLITSFVVSNPVAGSSVYLAMNQGVSAAGAQQGLEIAAGTAPNFKITQEDRQLYEIQILLAELVKLQKCQTPELEKIPFICWDLTQIYLFSANAAGSQVTIAAFPQMYL